MTTSREAWERVLAAVEADARRTEALLQTPPEEFAARSDELDAASLPGLPADWLLPMISNLPPLETMPPVPEELSDRILELRAQIIDLQDQLATALRDIPRAPARKMVAASAEVPAYIDRRL